MSSKKINIYKFVSKVILITLLIVLIIRCFFVESFTVSSTQMESSLSENDRIFIYKTSYGIRLPITILSIPFTFDNIFGSKSYSSAIELPYKRLFESRVNHNDIILFNDPTETGKPLDKKSLILSRVIGNPGDSIEMGKLQITINGQKYMIPPTSVKKYKIKVPHTFDINKTLNETDIHILDKQQIADTLILHLNKYDAFVLSESLPDSIPLITCHIDTTQSFKFKIPKKGENTTITEGNFIYYKPIIQRENNTDNIFFENGSMSIGGIKQAQYTFKDDYYWVLSDNKENSLDSRHLGFIPFSNIIGKAGFIWYSKDKSHRFSLVE